MNDQTVIDALTAVVNPARALLTHLCSSLAPEHRQQAVADLESLYTQIRTALEGHPDFNAILSRFFDQEQLSTKSIRTKQKFS
jgi:hypothetical protein